LEFVTSKHDAGIMSWQIVEDIQDVAEKLNSQMELIVDWRGKVYQYLTMSLENENEAQGMQFE
jgi:hypothetical protein